MSKEIKEKCKMCRYYNDKQQYPDVEGQTTHSNCISIKCHYSKITKDMQIRSLTNKIADLGAKLAEKEKAFDLMSIVLCTSARDDLKKQIGQFTLRKQVKEFFLKQAKKELENGAK